MKDFDKWNIEKKGVDKKNVTLYYHVREVWWCYLGVNVGNEQDGSKEKFLRPVVVIRAFGPSICLVVPLTTSKKEHSLRVYIGSIQGKEARAVLSQMKVVDKKRLLEKVTVLDKETFDTLRKTVRRLF